MNSQTCVLCSHNATSLIYQDRKRSFYQCPCCELVFVPSYEHVSFQKEKARYDQHQNSPEDEGYRKFLSQILAPLFSKIDPGCQGLDYGSGPSPVLAQMLREKGFPSDFYDPFYNDKRELLKIQYDFVTCTEVVEHFRNPRADWEELISLVKKRGWLAVMTQTTPRKMDFDQWYYQRDETHVGFYSDKTFRWIAGAYHLSIEQYGPSIVLFQR